MSAPVGLQVDASRKPTRPQCGTLLRSRGRTYHHASESRRSINTRRSAETQTTAAVTADWYEFEQGHKNITFSQPVSIATTRVPVKPGDARAFQISHWRSYCELVRISNILGTLPFAFVGALCARHSLAVALSPDVWAIMLVTTACTWGGNALNDYYDFASGTDVINAPTKPLPRGAVSPDKAILAAAALFISSLYIACCLQCAILRFAIVINTVLTILYTPVLKPIPLVKTVTISYLVASAPISAALAAGGGVGALVATLPLTGQLFGLMFYWQIVKDVRDVQGDEAAGITTLPVLIGSVRALAVGVVTALASTAVGMAGLARSRAAPQIAAALSADPAAVRLVLQVLLGLSVVPVLRGACALYSKLLRMAVDEPAIDSALGHCYASLSMGLTVLMFV